MTGSRRTAAAAAGALVLLSADTQAFSVRPRIASSSSGRRSWGKRCLSQGGYGSRVNIRYQWNTRPGFGFRMSTEESMAEVDGVVPSVGELGTTKAMNVEGEGSPDMTDESEKLRLTAEKLKLQAEKLRLEAEKEALILEAEKLEEKEAEESKQDEIITMLKNCLGGSEEAMMSTVKSNVKKMDADLFLRIADLAEGAGEGVARNTLVMLSEEVMRVLDKVDKDRAARVARGIKESIERLEEMERAKRARDAALAMVQASNATYGAKLSDLASLPGVRQAQDNVNMTAWEAAEKDASNNPPRSVDLRNLGGLLGDQNMTTGLPPGLNLMLLPLWVPPALLPFVTSAPALLDSDMEAIKSQVLGMDTFYPTGVEKSPFAALYKGNMRGKKESEVFEAVNIKLESIPGLRDRVELFMMKDPTPLTPEEMQMQMAQQGEAQGPQPVFVAVSKDAKPKPSNVLSYGLAVSTVAASAFTAFAYSIGTFALNTEFYQKITDGDISVAGGALPILGGILALQVVHELGHLAVAASKKVKLGPPIFIPSLQVGIFGAITPLLSFPKNRKEYFDIAASGPMAGALLSLVVFVLGVLFTGSATPEALAAFPVVPAGLFHSSLLVGFITSFTLPSAMLQAITAPIAVHPLALVGIAGIVVNALNLMPIGSLDGGRIAMATFGRKAGSILGTITLLLQAVSAVFNNYTLQLFWGLLVILFQRQLDLPAKDELTEVDDGRVALSVFLFLFSIITLIPFPDIGM